MVFSLMLMMIVILVDTDHLFFSSKLATGHRLRGLPLFPGRFFGL